MIMSGRSLVVAEVKVNEERCKPGKVIKRGVCSKFNERVGKVSFVCEQSLLCDILDSAWLETQAASVPTLTSVSYGRCVRLGIAMSNRVMGNREGFFCFSTTQNGLACAR